MRHTEQDTVKAILDYLSLHRIPAWRVNSGAFHAVHKGKKRFHRFGAPGMSDIVAIDPTTGTFVAIEVKATTGLTLEQAEFLTQIERAKGIAFVARSVADVEKKLFPFGRTTWASSS